MKTTDRALEVVEAAIDAERESERANPQRLQRLLLRRERLQAKQFQQHMARVRRMTR